MIQTGFRVYQERTGTTRGIPWLRAEGWSDGREVVVTHFDFHGLPHCCGRVTVEQFAALVFGDPVQHQPKEDDA